LNALTSPKPWLATLALAVGAALASPPAGAHGKPHVHGEMAVDVAVDGPLLTVQVVAPLDSLLGFEHRPRTPAQRQAAESVARRMTEAAWLKPAAAAQCVREKTEVDTAVLQPAPAAPAAAKPEAEHADLEATYTFRCAAPDKLDTLELALFEAFGRTQRVNVQVAGAKGQLQQVLRRPARVVRLVR
jgi:Protein of unknown function (DUF2796)